MSPADARCTVKITGADCELGNLVLGRGDGEDTCRQASTALLDAFEGIPGGPAVSYVESSVNPHDDDTGVIYNPRDWRRKYLDSNGGCGYIDLDHLEICTPETTSARDHLASWHAMLRIAREALHRANSMGPPGERIVVMVNNTDGHGHAYGSHLNFLMSRPAWEDIFARRLYPGLFVLMAYQVSSIVFTGQGKVGAENGQPPVDYQIAQRADFFEQLIGYETTFRRPICNTRDEALCGRAHARWLARLHCIFYDNTLCHVSTFLKVGVMQIVLAMLEAQCFNGDLILDDPLDALRAWSRDPGLSARARLACGREVTAVELQWRFVELADAFVSSGRCDAYVPEAAVIVALWRDTLRKLAARDFDALAGRLDWVLKHSIIERAMQQRPELTWSSPEVKHLDHYYSSLNETDGLYWAMEDAGLVERKVDEHHIDALRQAPPSDTRAWTRAMLLRSVDPSHISRIDWDRVDFQTRGSDGASVFLHGFEMPDPRAFTRSQVERPFRESRTLAELLERLQTASVHAARTPQENIQ